MTLSALPAVTQITGSLWAKSPHQTGEVKLGVLEHLLNVAACAAEILDLEPLQVRAQMAADLGLPAEQGLAWTLALVALHDLGKASPAFQVKWLGGKAEVDTRLEFSALLREPYTPHGVISEYCLPAFLNGQLGWPHKLAKQLGDAVGCHHGFRVESLDRENLSDMQVGQGGWERVRRELCRLVCKAVGADYAAVPAVAELSAPAFMRLAGLTSFADWLGSSFPLPTQTDFSAYVDPAAYFARARAQAREMLREQVHWPAFAPLHPELPPLEEVFGYLTEGDFRPRPLQTVLAEALAQVGGPALVLVEAPMGEGKTEAALYAYLQLQHAAQHRGLYVALPTQATGSAMFGRLVEFLRGQGSKKSVSIQLAHGGTLLNDPFQQRLENTRIFYRTNTDAAGDNSVEAVRVEEWFTSRKRALLDEFGVGTVDQALLGVLGVSHQFVRLWGLGNRVVVLDEVHAYDTYTSELIAALVSWLRALGSSVVIMSATLPDESRRRLLAAWGANDIPTTETYPRWTVATQAGEVTSGTVPDTDAEGNRSRPAQQIALRALDSSADAVAARAVELAVTGGCTAVIVNTVQRAQQVQKEVVRLLSEQGVTAQTCTAGAPKGAQKLGVLLYHARYPADERAYREKAVLKYLGKDGQRPERFILIATQVAEQSLDFDADVMISDLAPVDLLLQRAGRLHRHARSPESRRGHTEPMLYVSGLNEWPAEALKSEAWGRVYAPALLYRTWHTLAGRTSLTLPDDLDPLVQEVYGSPCPVQDLPAERRKLVERAEAKLRSVQEGLESKGRYAHIGLPDEFWQTPLHRHPEEPDSESVNDDALAGEDEIPRTRLGDKSVRIVPVMKQDGKWVVCPPPRALQPKKEPWPELVTQHQTLQKGDAETAKRIYRRSLSVSRWEIVAAAERGELWPHGLGSGHQGWQAHPLLRDVMPLDLTAGYRDLGKLRVCMNDELGVQYLPI
ncbi:CRISPR-associated helicase Cas3' [Deinococcus sp. Marseille-Q6407]|uniref:CRISPR-associated helicase Cas3' n=1 Tax=Deinococcus sp. Marseille-Q6407 TaxID=2969223 RepID=UPI0021C02C09|nr:CRISPR-associated helicase Cas3' [Deinococcus sp. Marseille-Q6407]